MKQHALSVFAAKVVNFAFRLMRNGKMQNKLLWVGTEKFKKHEIRPEFPSRRFRA